MICAGWSPPGPLAGDPLESHQQAFRILRHPSLSPRAIHLTNTILPSFFDNFYLGYHRIALEHRSPTVVFPCFSCFPGGPLKHPVGNEPLDRFTFSLPSSQHQLLDIAIFSKARPLVHHSRCRQLRGRHSARRLSLPVARPTPFPEPLEPRVGTRTVKIQ